MQSHYWAKFIQENQDAYLYRFDTRIYINPTDSPQDSDTCLGAIFLKNPGSAFPKDRSLINNGFALTEGDKTLNIMKHVLLEAYKNYDIKPAGYVQILNLFYLCEKDLTVAKRTIKSSSNKVRRDVCENKKFDWVWYAWGRRNELKSVVDIPRINTHSFYICPNGGLKNNLPCDEVLAKHPIGMRMEHLDAVANEIKSLCRSR